MTPTQKIKLHKAITDYENFFIRFRAAYYSFGMLEEKKAQGWNQLAEYGYVINELWREYRDQMAPDEKTYYWNKITKIADESETEHEKDEDKLLPTVNRPVETEQKNTADIPVVQKKAEQGNLI